MKKLLIATTLLTLTTTAFAVPNPQVGTLLLQGMVAKKVSITVTAEAVASALVLETSQTNLKVATAVEQSNSKAGYKVTVISANLGKLKRTDGSEVFAYTLKYGGADVGLSTSSGSVVTDSSSASVVNVSKDLQISYAGAAAETMVEGTYADTLTINIASK